MAAQEGECTAEEKTVLSELACGARAAFDNAEQLYKEALMLAEHRAFSRSLFLHQISMEELAKVDLLGGWATSLLMGIPVDLKKISREMASHKAKNDENAYMLPPGEAEAEAKKRGDWKEALDAFHAMKDAFHEKSNSAKNASLYVDLIDGKFVTPHDRITVEMVAELREINRDYLGSAHPKVTMFRKWEADPHRAKKQIAEFHRRMDELKDALPSDPLQALKAVLAEMLTEELKKREERS